MKSKLSIIIPVFNEATTISRLLKMVWDQNLSHVEKEMVIVESNSTDGSREIVQRFAQEINTSFPDSVKVILQERAGGKGKAVREGLAAATGDIILIQDGDLEYDVNDYGSLLEPIIQGNSDFVLGSRHLSADSWKIRKFTGNRLRAGIMNMGGVFFHGFFNFLYGTKLTDPTTMFKVFRKSCLKHTDLVSNRFDFDFELLAKLIRAGYLPVEVPVSYSSRGFEEGKKIRVFRDPLTWLSAIVRFRFCKLRSNKSIPVKIIETVSTHSSN